MIQHAMVTDDFSFPTITDPLPRFAGSPSLWRVSSDVHSDSSHGDTGGREEDWSGLRKDEHHQTKSFILIENSLKGACDDTGGEDEEKMDKLWEHFDELQRLSSFDQKKEGKRLQKSGGLEPDSDVARERVELCCVQALKMSKTSSGVLTLRRPNLLMIMKVVKKLFLLHNSTCPKNSKS